MSGKNVELASELIKFKSISQNRKELEDIIAFVERYFEGKGLFVKRHEINGKYSLVITFCDTKCPKILLSGHLDVVNAPDEDFIPKVMEGKLLGRGAADMKGSVAVMMLAMDHFANNSKKPSLGLMLTTDEEEGGFNGTGQLLQEYACDVAIIPDGGRNMSNIVNKAKGVLHLKIVAEGESAHSSRPWEGDNAIDKLINGYCKAKKIFPKNSSKNRWHPTMNLGVMNGGDKINKVPRHAEMLVDIRLTEKESVEGVFAKMAEAFEDCSVEIIATGVTFQAFEKGGSIKKYAKVLRKATAQKVLFIKEHGSSDARFFTAKNIPAIVNEPLCGNLHAENEWISIESMDNFYEILINYIQAEGFN